MNNEPEVATKWVHDESEKSSTSNNLIWLPLTLVIAFGILFIVATSGSSPAPLTGTPPTPVGTTFMPTPATPTTPGAVTGSSFSQISQVDKTRMTEIITGVMQNTVQVTPAIKSEFSSIIAKYNATETEVYDFAVYGPAFAANYQRLFYTDALQAVSTGSTVKSSERLTLEKEAVSRGLMTSARVESNDNEMNLIASHKPITGSDGRQVVFTVDNITSTLDNIGLITARLNSLWDPSSQAADQPVSEVSSLDKGCEDLHGPSVYKSIPASQGGGSYCDCKPGYVLRPAPAADGSPSSWCFKQ